MYNWKRNAAIFLSSQAISLFGSALVQYAITWHINLTTQSGFYVTLSIVCGILPTFLLSPFGGVWADRYNRKLLIALADGFIAFSTLILAIFFMLGYQEIWMLLVVSAVRGLGSGVQTPCVNAMLPDIVPADQLTRINGINGTLQSCITLASPMLSGALLSFANLQSIFFIDVITAALAIMVLVLFLRLPGKAAAPATEAPQTTEAVPATATAESAMAVEPAATPAPKNIDYFRDLKEGFRYIGKTPYLRVFFIFLAMYCFLVAPVAFLSPLQVTRNFGDDVWNLTALEMVWSVGMIVGGLLLSVWNGLKNRVHTMILTGVLMGIGTFVLGIPMLFIPYLVVMGLLGVMMPIFNTHGMVLLQQNVDPAYMGRVFGVMMMINSGIMPLAMMLFGPLADVIPIDWMLLATGLLMALGSLLMSRSKSLMAVGAKKHTPASIATQQSETSDASDPGSAPLG